MIEVELLSSEQAPDVFGMIDADADLNLTREEVRLHLGERRKAPLLCLATLVQMKRPFHKSVIIHKLVIDF